ncbi:tetratricopeptide repeat protein [Bacillus sp. NEB1478]|uniref:tetratricopeptide repeat protein n=1 Tax=Bacillus sp. NEB1478 TaxID=3073816 RepID=UPI0028738D10|nr:tetratricopeptide repeat protein [Bacillus sp. NEB1478]WNB93412.1 tetratricopeptide repeat protein [Bacillus sp. NEB1478]
MQKIIDDAYIWIKNNWHRISSLFFSYIFIFVAMVVAIGFDSNKISKLFWFVYILIFFVLTILWFYYRRLERCKNGKIGIVLAFKTENVHQFNKLQHDFIQQIKESLDAESFTVINLPYNRCNELNPNDDSMLKCLNKTQAHMLIYGVCREGKKKGKEKYEIKMFSMIRHKPLAVDTLSGLQNELNYFTNSMLIDKEDSLTSYKLSSNWLTTYARYFVGLAALISHDTNTSFKVFESLKKDLQKEKNSFKPVKEIKKRVNFHFSNVCLLSAIKEYKMFWKTKCYQNLEASQKYIELYESVSDDRYTPAIYHSIFSFLINRNINRAKGLLDNVQSINDSSHKFNMGFLFAYEGKITEAIKCYRQAIKMPNNEFILIEIEQFIEYILEIEPEKYHLYLCLAWINSFKGDNLLGKKDLQRFLRFATHDDKQRYISLIEEINIKLEDQIILDVG